MTALPFLPLLFGFSLGLSISLAEISVGLLVLTWIWTLLVKNKKFVWKKSPLDIPILIFVGWNVLSVLIHHSTSVGTALSKQMAFLSFFLVVQLFDKAEIKRLLMGFLGGMFLTCLLVGLQQSSGINFDHTGLHYTIPPFFQGWPEKLLHLLSVRNDRPVGSRSHPLTLAESLMPAFFFLLNLFVVNRKEKWMTLKTQIFCGALFLGVILSVILAQGRGVWLGLLMGLILYLFLRLKKIAWPVLGGLILGGGLFLSAAPYYRGRLLSVFNSHEGTWGDQQSKNIRKTLWQDACRVIQKNPVAGMGLRGVQLHAVDPQTGKDRIWSEAHNIYLQVGAEAGLVGLGLFIWIGWSVFLLLNKSSPHWRESFLALFLSFLVAGLTESWIRDKEMAMIFWVFVGSAFVLQRKENNEKEI